MTVATLPLMRIRPVATATGMSRRPVHSASAVSQDILILIEAGAGGPSTRTPAASTCSSKSGLVCTKRTDSGRSRTISPNPGSSSRISNSCEKTATAWSLDVYAGMAVPRFLAGRGPRRLVPAGLATGGRSAARDTSRRQDPGPGRRRHERRAVGQQVHDRGEELRCAHDAEVADAGDEDVGGAQGVLVEPGRVGADDEVPVRPVGDPPGAAGPGPAPEVVEDPRAGAQLR